MAQAMKRRHRKTIPELHIVIEAGHPNSGDAERIFLEIKKEFDEEGINMLKTLMPSHWITLSAVVYGVSGMLGRPPSQPDRVRRAVAARLGW